MSVETSNAIPANAGARGTDLLRWPVLGPFLRWRHARLALQLPLLVFSVVLVLHGLSGPQLAAFEADARSVNMPVRREGTRLTFKLAPG